MVEGSLLKGVMDGGGYPLFWIDLASGEKIYEVEDRLLGSQACSLDDVWCFAENFIRENFNYLNVPCIVSSEKQYDHYSIQCDQYREKIALLEQRVQNISTMSAREKEDLAEKEYDHAGDAEDAGVIIPKCP